MECMFHLDRVSLVVVVAELQFVSESVPQPAPPIVEDAKSTDLLSDRGSRKLNLLLSNLQDFWEKWLTPILKKICPFLSLRNF